MTKGETKNFCIYVAFMAVCFSILVNGQFVLGAKEAEAAVNQPEPDYPFYQDLGDLCEAQVKPEMSVEQEIRVMAKCHGINEEKAVAIAKCESSLNPSATNWQGSTAKGVFMFTDPTWKYIGAKGHQFDRHENISQFMRQYPYHKSWWACYKLVK